MDIKHKAPLLLQLMDVAFDGSEDDDEYMNLAIYSSSSSDEEDEETMANLQKMFNLKKCRKTLNKIPRLEGFVERIIPGYTANEFKILFRYVIFILIDIQLIVTIEM